MNLVLPLRFIGYSILNKRCKPEVNAMKGLPHTGANVPDRQTQFDQFAKEISEEYMRSSRDIPSLLSVMLGPSSKTQSILNKLSGLHDKNPLHYSRNIAILK
jgi:hypothetical protein